MEVVGYYQANESLKDNQPDIVALRISEKLAETNPNLLVVMVRNFQVLKITDCELLQNIVFYSYPSGQQRTA